MADEPGYISAFREFASGEPTLDDLPRLEAEVYGANDRACAVMLSSIVENALKIFIRHKTRPSLNSAERRQLFGFSEGPLGTFSSQIVTAYAFNFFGPETKHDLNLIRTIRNGFAHSRKSFRFDEPTLSAVCARLKSPDWAGAYIPRSYLELHTYTEHETVADMTNPKTRYTSACHIVAERLLDHSDIVGASRMWDLR